jgi:glycosyltransferase involved in cell wall biosynthesis
MGRDQEGKIINIIGTIFNVTGYDSHTRQLANALSKITDVRLSVNLPPNWPALATDKELAMIKKKPEKDEINLIITHPMIWKLHLTAKTNWVFLVWEGDRLPKGLMQACTDPRIDKILVPSKHTKNAIEKAFKEENIWPTWVMEKVKIVPHGVDLNLFYPGEKPKKCVFIANKGFRNMEDRGGIQYLLKAYIQEFTKADNVELILKINPAYGVLDINQIAKSMGHTENSAPIKVILDAVEYNKMVKFYNEGTVFVSPTRSEAYNLPCIEAMACGLPVITTKFGGQTDYCNDSNSWMISGELTEVKHELEYEGVMWMTPSIEELRNAMREAYSKPEKVESKGKEALKTAKQNTWDKSAKILMEFRETGAP